MKSTDMCKCGHPRSDHNNRSRGAVYYPEMKYNCCLATMGSQGFCDCVKFTKDRKYGGNLLQE